MKMNNHFYLHMQQWFCVCGGQACHGSLCCKILVTVCSTIFVVSLKEFWDLFFSHI